MSDVTTRVVVILAALAVALVLVWLERRRSGSRVRRVDARGLQPGVYLFTSATCADCIQARDVLTDRLGDAYTEIDWETRPDWFESLGVSVVPTTVVVPERGRATAQEGDPTPVLGAVGP